MFNLVGLFGLYITLITEILKQKRLKKDCSKCVMRNNALLAGQCLFFFCFFFQKNNEHTNSISKDDNSRNCKCLNLVLLHFNCTIHTIEFIV